MTTPLDLARRYMAIVFGDEPLAALREILAENCTFRGPFASFDTAADYIASMEEAPPEGWSLELIAEYADESSACLVYQFTKPGVSTPMIQRFTVREGQISEILLVFDGRAFLAPSIT